MHYVPLIYFSTLTYYFWRRHRCFDVATYMSLLYVVTSVCCVLMVNMGLLNAMGGGVLVDGWDPEFGIIPTILYCGLITLTIAPFSIIRPEMLENISNVHRKVIFAFTIFITLQGLIVIYLAGGSVNDILNGDFKDLKDAAYAGDLSAADIKMLTMPLPVRGMYHLSFMSLLGIPLFFYYTCIEKRSLWLTPLLLVISVSPIFRGMLLGDRTEIIHWALMFFFTLTFFKKFITRQVRNFFLSAAIPVFTLGIGYVLAVSESRFEREDEGSGGSMLEYAGQSYINFCYFYDNHNPNLIYMERELPFTSYILLQEQYVDTKEERTQKEGFFIGVFASHVGSWLIDTGTVGAIMLSALFALLCCLVIKRFNRRQFDIAEVLMLFALGTVPTFGIFYYRFYTIQTAMVYAAAIALYLLSKYIFTWQPKPEGEEETTET